MYCNTRNFIEHHTVGLYSGWSKKYAAKFCTCLRQIFTDYQFFLSPTHSVELWSRLQIMLISHGVLPLGGVKRGCGGKNKLLSS